MLKNISKIIIIFIILILIFAGAFFVYKNKFDYCSKYACFIEIKMSEEEYNKKLELIKETKENIKKDPENVDNYLSLGLYYKSIGKLEKSKSAYLDGIKISDNFYLYYLNLGNILVDMHDYHSAKDAYVEAIKNKTVETDSYLKLADLLVNHLNGTDKEIREVYYQGLINTGHNINITKSYAAYLEKAEQLNSAIDMWGVCLQSDPDNEEIKNKIKELKNKLKK